MSNGEFYRSGEINYIGENKSFPAEIYRKPTEENPLGKEKADTGAELTTLQKRKKGRASDGKNPIKGIMDRIFGSVRGVAVTATVAVSAAAVIGTAVAPSPSAELVSIDVGGSYVEYEIDVRGLDTELDYYLVVEAPSTDPQESRVESEGIQTARVENLKPEWEYTLSLQSDTPLLGRTTHFKYKFQTEKAEGSTSVPDVPPDPPPRPPAVTVTNAFAVGLDYLRVEFDSEETEEFSLLVKSSDGTESVITPYPSDIARGYVDFVLSSGDPTVTVTPFVTRDGVNVYGTELFVTAQDNLSVEAIAYLDSYYQHITFIPIGFTNGADIIAVESSEGTSPEYFYFDGTPVRSYFSTRGPINYTIYLTNENGDVLSNVVEITVDTTEREISGEYDITMLNPNNVAVSYNADGTMNAYLNYGFASSDSEIFYYARLGSYYLRSTDPVAMLERIPDAAYGMETLVCREIDGTVYALTVNYPSGAVNENYADVQGGITADGIWFSIHEAVDTDLDAVSILLSDEREIIPSASDFVYDGETGYYTVTVALDTLPEYADVIFTASFLTDALLDFGEYNGTPTKRFTERIYP